MALILAIEPDRKQSSKVAALVKNRLHAEIVAADTTEHAVELLAGRVPDLILTSLLLSMKDEAALADWLRESDAAGAHVQTLVIPVLGTSRGSKEEGGGGLLSRFTRGKSRDDAGTDGCDPEIFAAQIREYLDRAAEERRLAAQALEDLEEGHAAAPRETPAAAIRSAPVPAYEETPVYTPAYEETPVYTPAYEPAPSHAFAAEEPAAPAEQPDTGAGQVYFEVEAVVPDAMDAAPVDGDDAPAGDDDGEPWAEISLNVDEDAVVTASRPPVLALDDDDAASLELTSEPIDLQRFVEELGGQAPPPAKPAPRRPNSRARHEDVVLDEFEEALEGFTGGSPSAEEPTRPNVNSAADSEVLTPLATGAEWPDLEGGVAKAAGRRAADEPASGDAPAPRRARPRKRAKLAPADEWPAFDPEQCGFVALLAKLDRIADEAKPGKPGR